MDFVVIFPGKPVFANFSRQQFFFGSREANVGQFQFSSYNQLFTEQVMNLRPYELGFSSCEVTIS